LYDFDALDNNIFKNALSLLQVKEVITFLGHSNRFEIWID